VSPEDEFLNVEVFGHDLASFQNLGFCMDFLNHREGGMVFYQVFFLSPLQKLYSFAGDFFFFKLTYGFLPGFLSFSFTETICGCVSLKK
jgi:hypothetical protein